MTVPKSQVATIALHVLKQRLAKRERYPLVLMLEPLLRCNLSCAGCGKIQYPPHVLRRALTVEQCLDAVEECGAPVVSIPGGEPLLYPQIGELVEELVHRRKYVYLCTNALLLKDKLDQKVFTPSKRLTFSVHMDGLQQEHDASVCRTGVYDIAVEGIREAVRRGFRVTTNTTLFSTAEPMRVRDFFDAMMALDVEGMMVSPGFNYENAPDQDSFLNRERTHELFRAVLKDRKMRWRFNQSPLFLQFLMGKRDFECTPWGNPLYTIFGWQRPCYLMQDGYAATFMELMEETAWEEYGRASGNPQCQDCMVHSGYEPTAVHATFCTWRGLRDSAIATMTGKL
ncbi:MAG: adenosyl-hopene transferase HpnH [Chloroflexota bacterium]|nr:adenosyl-hopene transferase HpnH [Chloroflexota bacterium]